MVAYSKTHVSKIRLSCPHFYLNASACAWMRTLKPVSAAVSNPVLETEIPPVTVGDHCSAPTLSSSTPTRQLLHAAGERLTAHRSQEPERCQAENIAPVLVLPVLLTSPRHYQHQFKPLTMFIINTDGFIEDCFTSQSQ